MPSIIQRVSIDLRPIQPLICPSMIKDAFRNQFLCYLAGLKTTTQRSRASLPPLQTGQVWGLEGSNLHIGLIGKTLVHYKHFKGDTKRAPISLSGKATLEKYLKEKKAVLLQNPAPATVRAVA